MKKKLLYLFILVSSVQMSYSQSLTDFIVVDQFGYRPNSEKVAVIRNPQVGFDAAASFTPGTNYALVNADNQQTVFSGSPIQWNNGATDPSSGDIAWWFDFSNFTSIGTYYVLDVTNNVRSFEFEIREDIYDDVLKHAVRTFFYQRVGFAKTAPFAETGWEDGASHMGPQQDGNARRYNAKNDASTERDVSGGWYDAGDYNKYTTWTANYVYDMLLAYKENPNAWTDDYDLPESGNGIPDIIDEAKWGMDHILRLQLPDGSMISTIGLSHASPPSAATGPSYYGGVNTSSTLCAASVFAFGAKVFHELDMIEYANTLQQAAINAWNWAEANPNVLWRNNDAANQSQGIGAGQQETNDYNRFSYKMRAAMHLYEITNIDDYKSYFENRNFEGFYHYGEFRESEYVEFRNYEDFNLFPWYFAFPFQERQQATLLYYTTIPGVSTTVVNNILGRYRHAMNNNDDNFKAYNNNIDPYMAHIKDYGWGSNNTKSNQGNMFHNVATYNVEASKTDIAKRAAERFVHYIHGVNPLNLVYLSNMYGKGGKKCVNQFYHTWFREGSPLWDEVGVSTYGPAPGFLAGGPNPNYDLDGCCANNNCGSTENNALCWSKPTIPPRNQPSQKSYLDFNDNWPLNSWSVTENSCGYQISYIRLLSKFVDRSDVLTVENSTSNKEYNITLSPNPATNTVTIHIPEQLSAERINIYTVHGTHVLDIAVSTNRETIGLSQFEDGVYIVTVKGANGSVSQKLVISN